MTRLLDQLALKKDSIGRGTTGLWGIWRVGSLGQTVMEMPDEVRDIRIHPVVAMVMTVTLYSVQV